MAIHSSGKYLQLSRAQQEMLAIIAIAVVVCVFSLVGFKTMLGKGNYQRKVINEKHKIIKQLEANYTAAKALSTQYGTFAALDPNIIGGKSGGSGGQDGSNPQIVLDALPSKYDAPALASSVEKLLNADSASIRSINVKDDPANNPDIAVPQPSPHALSFSFEAATSFSSAQQIFKDFERSIRPFDVTKLEITGSDNALILNVNMNTYYQPAKSLDLPATREVK